MKEEKRKFANRKTGFAGKVFVGIWVVLFCCFYYAHETKAGELLAFDEQGNLRMTTHDRIATSNIIYKTVGWTIKRYDMPIGAPGNDSVVVVMENDGSSQQDLANPAYKYSFFLADKQMIFNRIGEVSPEWQQDLYLNGGTVYLDAVMTVCYSDVPQGGLEQNGDASWGRVYYNFTGIAGAESWSDREALRSHFDKQVYFGGNPALLDRTCRYDVSYYECFDDQLEMWPLSRYGKDGQGELDLGAQMSLQPEDLRVYDFTYISAHVVKAYEDGRTEDRWIETCPILIENLGDGINTIKVEFYYKRQNYVNYLRDRFHMDGDSVLLEGTLAIGAGTREEATFDVGKGVPTGENLYIQGSLNALGYTVKYANYYGRKTMPIRVVSLYQCHWTDVGGVENHMQWIVPEIYYVDRPYSYWVIEEIEVYTLKGVTVYNYAFDKEAYAIEDVYLPKVIVEQKEEHRKPYEIKEHWVDGGVLIGDGRRPDFPFGIRQTEANLNADSYRVANDTFSVDEEVFLDGTEALAYGASPKLGSSSGKIDFYEKELQIPIAKRNGKAYESSANIRYEKFSDKTVVEKPFLAVNPVTLHTPVICHGYVTDEKRYNQLCKPEKDRKTWILGRTFRVLLSAYGQHLDQLGYGLQDYERYVRQYQIQFPFPVYDGTVYYEAGTWIDYRKEADTKKDGMSFDLPTGVEEGNYTVTIRSLAYNATATDETAVEEGGNYEILHYGAFEEIPVAVCGRLYGMKITEIDQESWKEVFYNQEGNKNGYFYTIGLHNLNGELVRHNALATFPILAGGNPLAVENEGEPLGVAFSFCLESIGNYGENDGVYIEPEFYVIDSNGANRKQVDLYHFYEENGEKRWKNIKESPVSGVLNLTKESRSNIGKLAQNVKDDKKAIHSVQKWEGNFVVPDEVFVVPFGTDVEAYVRNHGSIEKTDSLFIRKGYLMVNFAIYTKKNGENHLSYINEENTREGYANMWKIEGFTNPKLRGDKSEFSLEYGDVFLYDLQKHLKDSHEIMGTH